MISNEAPQQKLLNALSSLRLWKSRAVEADRSRRTGSSECIKRSLGSQNGWCSVLGGGSPSMRRRWGSWIGPRRSLRSRGVAPHRSALLQQNNWGWGGGGHRVETSWESDFSDCTYSAWQRVLSPRHNHWGAFLETGESQAWELQSWGDLMAPSILGGHSSTLFLRDEISALERSPPSERRAKTERLDRRHKPN